MSLLVCCSALALVACDDSEESDPTDTSTADATSADGTDDVGTDDATATTDDATGPDGGGDATAVESVTIAFSAGVGGTGFSCDGAYMLGTGPTPTAMNDARLYVHDVGLVDDQGEVAMLELAQDGLWQYENIALLDFEDATAGCADNGTADTNDTVVGNVPADRTWTGLTFRVGIPFEHNHIDASTAPSPLNVGAMHWHWQGGYKFARVDLALDGGGGWNMHLGSTMCVSDAMPIPPTEPCGRPNVPTYTFDGFTPGSSTVAIDLAALFAGADITQNTMDTPPGCQSFPPDVNECADGGVFPALGLDFATGECANGCADQTVFSIQ